MKCIFWQSMSYSYVKWVCYMLYIPTISPIVIANIFFWMLLTLGLYILLTIYFHDQKSHWKSFTHRGFILFIYRLVLIGIFFIHLKKKKKDLKWSNHCCATRCASEAPPRSIPRDPVGVISFQVFAWEFVRNSWC